MKNFVKFAFVVAMISTSFLLSACNQTQSSTASTNPSNQNTKKTTSTTPSTDEMVPTLTSNINGQTGNFKLSSQLSHYLTADKSSVEILLSSSAKLTCQNLNPQLAEGEQLIKVALTNQDKSPIQKAEFKTASNQNMTAVIMNSDGTSTKFENADAASAIITDMNAAIIRGNLRVKNETMNVQGAFFTGICK